MFFTPCTCTATLYKKLAHAMNISLYPDVISYKGSCTNLNLCNVIRPIFRGNSSTYKDCCYTCLQFVRCLPKDHVSSVLKCTVPLAVDVWELFSDFLTDRSFIFRNAPFLRIQTLLYKWALQQIRSGILELKAIVSFSVYGLK